MPARHQGTIPPSEPLTGQLLVSLSGGASTGGSEEFSGIPVSDYCTPKPAPVHRPGTMAAAAATPTCSTSTAACSTSSRPASSRSCIRPRAVWTFRSASSRWPTAGCRSTRRWRCASATPPSRSTGVAAPGSRCTSTSAPSTARASGSPAADSVGRRRPVRSDGNGHVAGRNERQGVQRRRPRIRRARRLGRARRRPARSRLRPAGGRRWSGGEGVHLAERAFVPGERDHR